MPGQFVLKCNHDSGGLVICRDKNQLDIEHARQKINKCLKHNFYYQFREWAYKDVRPRIIAEQYMENEPGKPLTDYKFFCFSGEPRILNLSNGLENHKTAEMSFFDMNGKNLFCRKDYKPMKGDFTLPDNFAELTDAARKLAGSIDTCFVRIDLYDIKGNIYFGEITFYPNGGYIPFEPEEWDNKLGSWIDLK